MKCQDYRFLARPDDAVRHAAICRQAVRFHGNCTRLGSGYLSERHDPAGPARQIFTVVKRLAVPCVGHIAIERGPGGSIVFEVSGNNDDAIAILDGHGAGPDRGRPAKSL